MSSRVRCENHEISPESLAGLCKPEIIDIMAKCGLATALSNNLTPYNTRQRRKKRGSSDPLKNLQIMMIRAFNIGVLEPNRPAYLSVSRTLGWMYGIVRYRIVGYTKPALSVRRWEENKNGIRI